MHHSEANTHTPDRKTGADQTTFTFRPAPSVQVEMGFEDPLSFEWGNGTYFISRVVKRWLKAVSLLGNGQREWIEVETTANVQATLYFDERTATWRLAELKTPCAPPEPRQRRVPRHSVFWD